jgi:Zn-dependent oligopeptidase
MLENYVWEGESLRRMSGHYQTNAPIPDAMLQRQLDARMAMAGLLTRRQVRQGQRVCARMCV